MDREAEDSSSGGRARRLLEVDGTTEQTPSIAEESVDTLPRRSPGRCRRWMQAIFPYLKLKERTERPFCKRCCRRHPQVMESFMVGAILWLAIIFLFSYVLLAIGSTTFVAYRVDQHGNNTTVAGIGYSATMAAPRHRRLPYNTLRKSPPVGSHYNVVLLIRHVIEVLLLHHICGNLMEPLEGMSDHKFEHTDLMKPYGVVSAATRFFDCLTRTPHRVRWVSSFVADHVLLALAGACAIPYKVAMCCQKLNTRGINNILTNDVNAGSPATIVLEACTSVYVTILVIGFLTVALEDTVVAKKGHRLEFYACMALLIALWSISFLTILFDRQVYASAWIQAPAFVRFLAAGAQVFITHSTVMLGAVAMGHSAHFRKCPDLTWRVLGVKMVPTVLAALLIFLWIAGRRFVHSNASCMPLAFAWLAQTWPYFYTCFTAVGGLLLIAGALAEPRPVAESLVATDDSATDPLDDFSLASSLDYDSGLILVTSSAGLFWHVAMVYDVEANDPADGPDQPFPFASFFSYLLGILGPVGLAAFTFSAWRRPPIAGTWRSRLIWFAFFFALVQFGVFQEKEDCEMSSSLPGCCNYPWFPDVDDARDLHLRCNKPLRCSLEPQVVDGDKMPKCWLGEEEPDHADEPDEPHDPPGSNAQRQPAKLGRRLSRLAARRRAKEAAAPWHRIELLWSRQAATNSAAESDTFTAEQCKNYTNLWNTFVSPQRNDTDESLDGLSWALKEVSEEEEHHSTAFRLFVTAGQAANVEMCFTILGVLLKLIFFTQHENSEGILALDSHHHKVDAHSGRNCVVRVSNLHRFSSILGSALSPGIVEEHRQQNAGGLLRRSWVTRTPQITSATRSMSPLA